eukprot:1158705-Pelagomonas_calceolata.AAC.28
MRGQRILARVSLGIMDYKFMDMGPLQVCLCIGKKGIWAWADGTGNESLFDGIWVSMGHGAPLQMWLSKREDKGISHD